MLNKTILDSKVSMATKPNIAFQFYVLYIDENSPLRKYAEGSIANGE
jgi:hypothetical protein